MDNKIGDLIYTFRNLLDALSDRYDSFERDEELQELIDESQRALDKYTSFEDEDVDD